MNLDIKDHQNKPKETKNGTTLKDILHPPLITETLEAAAVDKHLMAIKDEELHRKKSRLKSSFLLNIPSNVKTAGRVITNTSIEKSLDGNHSGHSRTSSKSSDNVSRKNNKVVPKSNPQINNSSGEKLHPFLFPDFEFVYKLLKNNPSLKSKTAEVVITGFESYLVETWVLERELTSTLSAYSGNPNSVIKCCQIYLPMQPNLWSYSELKHYYKIMAKLGFLKYVNGKGFIFVADIHNLNLNHYQITNLLLIPNGVTIKEVWNNFSLNLNLRELQCAGRTSSMFHAPNAASVEKFYQIFRIPKKSLGLLVYDYYLHNSYDPNLQSTSFLYSNRPYQKSPFLPICTDVDLLIYMVQISLIFFNLLDKNCTDGLLCKKTQRALVKWQKTYGAVYFPQLNQSLKTSITFNRINTNLITALLSLVLVSFYKLKSLECIVFSNSTYQQKDPFMDPSLMFKGIVEFQKKLESKKMKLDDNNDKNDGNNGYYIEFLDFVIIDKLFELTDDTDQSEFTQVKRFIKSTVKDLNVAKNGIGKIVSNVGTNTSLASLSSNSMITNSIEAFVTNIQHHRSVFKNSETLLATSSITLSPDNAATRVLSDKQIIDSRVQQTHRQQDTAEIKHTKENDSTSSFFSISDKSKSSVSKSVKNSVKDNSPSSNENSISLNPSSPLSSNRSNSNKDEAGETDLRKKSFFVNHDKTIRMKFPGQISSMIGYIWLDVNFPIQTFFSRSKNREYDYGFYNAFVWYKYGENFDPHLQINFKKENNRLVDDITMLKNEKKNVKDDSNQVLDDENINEIVERFRIHQFYSSFNAQTENSLDEISKELYDYYNYKYVQNMDSMNNSNNINKGTKYKSNSKDKAKYETNALTDMPVDDNLIDINSKAHKQIYEKFQEGLLQTKLEDYVKKEIYDPEFYHELKRRNSFPDTKNSTDAYEKPILIRSDSFSTVEESIFHENSIIHLNKLAFMIKRDVYMLNSFNVYSLDEPDNEVFLVLNDLNEQKIPAFEKNLEIIKTNLYQQLQTNTTQIEKQKKQFDSTVSKYSYDTRLLERKFKNCIETQELFEVKLQSLQKKLLLEAKYKGIQYLIQLYCDDCITIDDIKGIYNNPLVSRELDKVAIKLKDVTDPKSIVDAMNKSKLRIFYKSVNEGIIISTFKLLITIFQYFYYKIKKSSVKKEVEEEEEDNDIGTDVASE